MTTQKQLPSFILKFDAVQNDINHYCKLVQGGMGKKAFR